MSVIIKNTRSLVDVLSSSTSKLAVMFIIAGLFFFVLGFIGLSGSQISSLDHTNFFAIGLGGVLLILGLLIYRKGSKNEEEKGNAIVFYSPTIKGNSFFMELLDYSVQRAKEMGYKFVIEKGDLEQFHAATNYANIIRKYSGSRASNTVLIMIPPSPTAYEEIWKLPKELKVNLVTLDMGIEGHETEYDDCPFHKRVILVDNRYGATLAAKEIVSFCKDENIQAINVIICEGNFHSRGQLFKSELERLTPESNLDINFLAPIEKLSFSDAVKKAHSYIRYVVNRKNDEMKERNTFIFCANDNLAIGARMELSQIAPVNGGSFKPIRIICFDASTFVKMHIDLEDRYLWRAIDQNYTEIVREAIESAVTLLEGQNLTKEPVKVKPTVYKRFRKTISAQ